MSRRDVLTIVYKDDKFESYNGRHELSLGDGFFHIVTSGNDGTTEAEAYICADKIASITIRDEDK